MTVTAGRHSAPAAPRPSVALHLVGYAAAVLASAAAWFFLVRAAIHFGTEARGGESLGWVFMGLVAVGAICCLVLALALAGRILMATGLISDYKPRRARRLT